MASPLSLRAVNEASPRPPAGIVMALPLKISAPTRVGVLAGSPPHSGQVGFGLGAAVVAGAGAGDFGAATGVLAGVVPVGLAVGVVDVGFALAADVVAVALLASVGVAGLTGGAAAGVCVLTPLTCTWLVAAVEVVWDLPLPASTVAVVVAPTNTTAAAPDSNLVRRLSALVFVRNRGSRRFI